MTDRPLRRGRRDNGLSASEYAVAADVDPRVGEHLLDLLAADHIAAYLQPTSDVTPGMLSTVLPSRPTDRLHVDSRRLADAREHVGRLGAEALSSDDMDARWAELVAQLESEEDGRDTSAEEPPRSAGGGTDVKDLRLPRLRSAMPTEEPEERSLLDALDADFSDDDDEGYTPPPPPPLPSIPRPAALSLAVIALGVVVMFWPQSLGYLGIHGQQAAMLFAAAALIGGGAGLVWQLRPARDEDEDPSDGAQV